MLREPRTDQSLFEENKRGTLLDVAAHFKAKTVKGEIVIVLAGK
jgi:16S rRNA (cytidine1402-2'-O)-methyltransferase